MTRWPLTVSVGTIGGLRPVTRQVSGLAFGSVAPGGAGTCSFTLRVRPGELPGFGPASRVVLSDARTGRIVWDGFAEYPDPVRGEGADGFAVSAVGAMVLLTDESKPRFFVDGPEGIYDESRWRRVKLTAPGATVEFSTPPSSDDEADGAYVTLQFPSGQAVDNSSRSGTQYDFPVDAGVPIVGLHYGAGWGIASANYGWRITGTGTDGSGRKTVVGGDFSGFGVAGIRVALDGASLSVKNLRLQIHRLAGGVTNVASDNVLVYFFDLSVLAQLARLDGSVRSSLDSPGSNFYGIYPQWAVEDMVARMPDSIIDKAASTVDSASTLVLQQLAYPEGATVAQVLDDLALLEPDYTWEVGARADSGHPFHYRPWTDRYLLPRSSGIWDAEGSDVDLCNRIEVTWQTRSGRTRSLTVTAAVAVLGDRTRDAEPIVLPAGIGSVPNAQRIGEKVLASLANPPASGAYTTTGRVYDKRWGRWVEPWEVQAGWKATLQETGETLRVTEVACSDDQGTAVLSLGQRSLTIEQRVARLDNTRRGGRGRRRRGNH